MKKRMFVCFFIFTISVFHLSIPNVVFGQQCDLNLTELRLNNYDGIFRNPKVNQFFPDFLLALQEPTIHFYFMDPNFVKSFVNDPRQIWGFYPEADQSLVVLLTVDDQFRKLFNDPAFHAVLQDTKKIGCLATLIDKLKPIDDDECPTLEPEPPRATTLSIVSGNSQSADIGKPLAQPFIVGVLDRDGKPIKGIKVTFTLTGNDGELRVHQYHTNEYGQAQTTLTLGSRVGNYSVTASAEGITQTQTFTANATETATEPIQPDVSEPRLLLNKISGDNQTGEPGKQLSAPFKVRVVKRNGTNNNPVHGIGVTFEVVGGGGKVSSDGTTITNKQGYAQVSLTLGPQEGENKVWASVVGVSKRRLFTAKAVAPKEKEPDLYWINGGNTLWYRDASGKEDTLLQLENDSMPTGNLALDMNNRRVYWTEMLLSGGGRIRSVSLDDATVGKVIEVKKILAKPRGITVDAMGNRIYWTTDNGKIQRINVNSSGPIKSSFDGNFIEGLDSPVHIAFDAERGKLYWTEGASIKCVDPDKLANKSDVVSRESGQLGGIAVVDDVVYWTEQTNGLGTVRSVKSAGSGAKLLAVTESIHAGIAVNPGKKVYWTTTAGNIQSVPIDAIQTVVTREEGSITGIALGGTAAPGAAGAPSLSPIVSAENTLLANYPNPFNPETWIPYQLSASADVSISIYSVNGHLVRQLELGHQSAGVYRSRSRAAYWDGRNTFGERVASGLYFYTLTAGDFTATRKMLIRK